MSYIYIDSLGGGQHVLEVEEKSPAAVANVHLDGWCICQMYRLVDWSQLFHYIKVWK